MYAQVEPLTKSLEEKEEERLRALGQQKTRVEMYRTLAQHASSAVQTLGARDFIAPQAPAEGGEVGFLNIFTMIVDQMEVAAKNQDSVDEDKCRDLLGHAVTRIFSNLLDANPCFDFDTVLKRVEKTRRAKLSKEVNEHVEALPKTFSRKVVDEAPEAPREASQAPEEASDGGSSEEAEDGGSSE